MTTLTIPNVPAETMKRLRQSAARHGRTPEREVLAMIDAYAVPEDATSVNGDEAIDVARFAESDSLVATAREIRAKYRGPEMSIDEIQQMIDEGRA